jgi:hypothetical protein
MNLTFKQWLDETTLAGGGHVRGLGQVSGESPGGQDDILYYQNCNMQDADTRDNQLKAMIKTSHSAFHSNPTTANKEASRLSNNDKINIRK